jgi:ubiquitin-conjugating enzyme E2 W
MFLRRLQKELKMLRINPPDGIQLAVDTDSLVEWSVSLLGPGDSLYEKQEFKLLFRFSKDYPLNSPEVVFIGNIPVHPHIYSNGHICLSILYDQWTPALSVSAICLSLQSMLGSCTELKRPADDVDYCGRAPKSPKDSNWVFHDDNV